MAKALKPRFTGDFFDIEAFSVWLLSAVFSFSNIRKLADPHWFQYELRRKDMTDDGVQSIRSLTEGLAYIHSDSVDPIELETVFRENDHHLFIAFSSAFSADAVEVCRNHRVNCFDQFRLRTEFLNCFAHQPMDFQRDEVGGFVLSINRRLFSRLTEQTEFSLFKNGSLGKYLKRGDLLVLVSEPSIEHPLGGCRGMAIIKESFVDTADAIWERFSENGPIFDKREFDAYTREKTSVLGIRVSGFQLTATIGYYTLVRDIIQQSVDVAELGCCYLSRDMAERFKKMAAKTPNGHVGRYDFAISFAGEDRKHAEDLAKILVAKGKRVFYDAYETEDLLGTDLYQHLQYVFRDSAEYCVVFLSANYAKKVWTRHELKQAQARAFERGEDYILPIRIDNTEIPGINETVGFIDLKSKSVSEIAEILIKKLKKKHSEKA